MKKKIISRILLGSALMFPLFAIAASCGIKQKDTENNPNSPDEKWKKELNDEANKVTLNYPKKETILPSEAVNDSFIFLNYDTTKFKISSIFVIPNNRGGILAVSFKVADLKDNKKESDAKELMISGFKTNPITEAELKELDKKIEFNYPNKVDVYPWDVNPDSLIVTNQPPNTKISMIEVSDFVDDTTATISYNLTDEYNDSTRVVTSKSIKGFKKHSKDHSTLTKVLLKNSSKYASVNAIFRTKVNLYKELYKPDSEVVFNFTKNEFIISRSRQISLIDRDSYSVVGGLNPAFTTINNALKLELMKLLGESLTVEGIDVFTTVGKFLALPMDEALKEFEIHKSKLNAIKNALSANVNFLENYDTAIKEHIENDLFSIIYDPKSGIFALQKGEDAVDLKKPKTFVNIIEFKKPLRDKITEKIKEVLTVHGADETIKELFLDSSKYDWELMFQLTLRGLNIGLKIKQLPSFS